MRQAGKTQILKLGELVPHPSNYRSHGSEQVARLAESLNRYGQYRPVVVQAGTNRILAGHGVVQAAKQAGEETIAATVVECDDATALAILVEDNESTYGAEDDRTALAELLADLGDARPPSFPDDRVEDLLREVTMPRMGDGAGMFDEVRGMGMDPDVLPNTGFHFSLEGEEAAIVRQALDAAKEELGESLAGLLPVDASSRAFLLICERFLT